MLQKLKTDLKMALKNRERVKVSVLRMLISEIHNTEINKKRELEEEEIISVLRSSEKKHRDSISQFESAGRADLLDNEKKELEIIQSYLPEPFSEQELLDLVKEVAAETGASGPVDFGKVMKPLMSKIKGRADGKQVSEAVKKILDQKAA